MHREIAALIDRQREWAGPLGNWAQPILARAFHEGGRRPVKDALNGTWFGHPVHPAVTDVPVGAMTLAALFDVTGRDAAADTAVAVGIAGMLAAAATGASDAVDTYGRERDHATLHGTLMVTSAGVYLLSGLLRLGPRAMRPLARLLGFAGYGVMTAGAYVGGDLTYGSGNQVDRHAFEARGTKWRQLDVSEVPVGKLVKAKAGADTLVLYRAVEGAPITALHGVCSHQGGPLDKGTIVDSCVECPWHQSRFDLASGQVRQGPAVFDQPRFEVRETAEGGLEARRMPSAAAAGE